MDIGLITGCMAGDVRPMTDLGLQKLRNIIVVSINTIVQACKMPNSLLILDSTLYIISVTINPKERKGLLSDPDPSPSSPFGTYTSPVLPLGNIPRKLGPQVEVN